MLIESLWRRVPRVEKSAAATIGFLCLCCACAQAQHGAIDESRGATAGAHLAQRGDGANTDIRSSWVNNSDWVELQARNVEFTDDGRDVKAVAASGSFSVAEERAGLRRQLEIVRSESGGLKRTYSVQGQARPFDAEAQAWLSGVLLEYHRRSDSSADRRVGWILQRQGAEAVLGEVSHITGDQVKRAYLQALFEQRKPNSKILQRGIEQATREFTNDYDLAEFLLWVNEHTRLDEGARPSFFKAVDKMNSDSDRRRVLAAAVNAAGTGTDTMRMALRSAMQFKSDYYLVEFLVGLAKTHAVGDELRPDFLTAVKRLRSNSDQARAMSALGDDGRRP